MKKHFTVALSAIVLFSVSACAHNKPPQPTPTAADASSMSATTVPQTTQQPTTQPPTTQQPKPASSPPSTSSAMQKVVDPAATPIPAGGYLLPLDKEVTLACVVDYPAGVIADCSPTTYAITWKATSGNHPQANRIKATFSPLTLNATGDGAAVDGSAFKRLDAGKKYSADAAIIDLTAPGSVTIREHQGPGVRITRDSFEKVSASR
ncbi:hypothetical protein [Corynebacterium ulcerans]|uniref:hypothetical protein n=1 Tax=Corynebacterium ulcerans TaxID=65058 RepID=UPI000269D1AD|nr:hypothetical protein [Corynebacterium ulcerans]KPH78551.1 hypothetical protein AFK72_00575 [Corynebacterium ulcerans]MBL4944429.1 hypothetical protein [Corynebacterium ulcerans]OIS06314.1 hypothetical protein BHG00_06000 [Corynebacterium ulcerans]QGZ24545.1 hypothetical protein CpMRi49_00585 [Corynebacterium ulcerans]QOE23299.1 hypothetical protein HUF05_01110 [Corynebacterium ulcerans]